MALSTDYPKTWYLHPLLIEIPLFSTEVLEVVWSLSVDRFQVNVCASDLVGLKSALEASAEDINKIAESRAAQCRASN